MLVLVERCVKLGKLSAVSCQLFLRAERFNRLQLVIIGGRFFRRFERVFVELFSCGLCFVCRFCELVLVCRPCEFFSGEIFCCELQVVSKFEFGCELEIVLGRLELCELR